jgi:uncharacterized lipoprotein YddW (UPF0748 family)
MLKPPFLLQEKNDVPDAMIRAAALVALLGACAAPPASIPGAGLAPTTVAGADAPPPVEREFRGVWVASVANLDWPTVPGLPPDSQRAELVRFLDRAVELRLNAVILQVRPAADALYVSDLEPWSEFLTGQQGLAPSPLYDPLHFAVEQAHARGIELHAWFNPYRAWSPAASGTAAASHISRAQPELVGRYGSFLWMDPGEDAVRRRSVDVILDVVRRYDIDGVHVDDYFYPYREADAAGREIEFPDSVSWTRYRAGGGTLSRSDWRRSNVDRFVAEMYDGIKRAKPWVKVGISPIGTWRPNVTPQLGGFDAYEQIYADARKWLREGTLDYMVPQLYWPIARVDVSFPVLLDWWVGENVRGRGVYAGMNTSNVNFDATPRAGWTPDEVLGQVYIARGHPGAEGHVHFRMGTLMPGFAMRPIAGIDTMPAARADSLRARQRAVQARQDTLATRLRDEAYARPALTPAMPWLGDSPPRAPRATLRDGTRLTLEPGAGTPPFLWVVQSRTADGWRTEVLPAATREATVAGSGALWVSAVDRLGNQSVPVRGR